MRALKLLLASQPLRIQSSDIVLSATDVKNVSCDRKACLGITRYVLWSQDMVITRHGLAGSQQYYETLLSFTRFLLGGIEFRIMCFANPYPDIRRPYVDFRKPWVDVRRTYFVDVVKGCFGLLQVFIMRWVLHVFALIQVVVVVVVVVVVPCCCLWFVLFDFVATSGNGRADGRAAAKATR